MAEVYNITGQPTRRYADMVRATAPIALDSHLSDQANALNERAIGIDEDALALTEAELEQARREYEESMRLQQAQLAAAEDQADISTAISAGGLGVQGAPYAKDLYNSMTSPDILPISDISPPPNYDFSGPTIEAVASDLRAVDNISPPPNYDFSGPTIEPAPEIAPINDIPAPESYHIGPTGAVSLPSISYSATPLGGVSAAGEANVAGLSAAEAAATGSTPAAAPSALPWHTGLGYLGAAMSVPTLGPLVTRGLRSLSETLGFGNGDPNLSLGGVLDALEGRPVQWGDGYLEPERDAQGNAIAIVDPTSGGRYDLTDENQMNQVRQSYAMQQRNTGYNNVIGGGGRARREELGGLPNWHTSASDTAGLTKEELDAMAARHVDDWKSGVLQSPTYAGNLKDGDAKDNPFEAKIKTSISGLRGGGPKGLTVPQSIFDRGLR